MVATRRRDSKLPDEVSSNITWITKSLADVAFNDLTQIDVLVHLAATGVSPQKATWEQLFQVNVLDSISIWKRAIEAGIRRIVVCGSCHEYGRSGDDYEFIPVDALLQPVTAYAASKAAATQAALALAVEESIEMVLLRPFNCYGEGQHASNLWPRLRDAALAGDDFAMTSGDQIRDFVLVDRVASAFLDSCETNELTPGTPIIKNVGSGEPKSVAEFAIDWWRHWNAKGNLKIGAIPKNKNEVHRFVPLLP